MAGMTDQHAPKPLPPDDAEARDPDVTMELDLDASDEGVDLQLLADEVAEKTEDADRLIAHELESTLLEARTRIQELEKREAEYLDKHHRLLADFANYRNRTQSDIKLAVDLAERKVLLEILPVLDNFERSQAADYASVEDLQNGVALIQKQFQDALRRLGVEALRVEVGDLFNAHHAEALTTTSNPEIADGAVAAVFERGYRLRELLLRPARVVVNHRPHPEEPPAEQPAPDLPLQ